MSADDATKKSDLGALLVIVGLIALTIFLISDSWRDPAPVEFVKEEVGAWAPRPLHIGEVDFVSSGIGKEAIIVATKEELEEIIKAQVVNDDSAWAQLILAKRAFFVPNITRIILMESEGNVRKVGILDGDAARRSGWVPNDGSKPSEIKWTQWQETADFCSQSERVSTTFGSGCHWGSQEWPREFAHRSTVKLC